MNCSIACKVLGGASGPHRDIVLVNAAAALLAAGHTGDLTESMRLAGISIDSGAAWRKVQALRKFSEKLENIPAVKPL